MKTSLAEEKWKQFEQHLFGRFGFFQRYHSAKAVGKFLVACFKRTAKTLIRLGGCPGWSESSLGAHAILLVLSRCGSYFTWKILFSNEVSVRRILRRRRYLTIYTTEINVRNRITTDVQEMAIAMILECSWNDVEGSGIKGPLYS